MDSDLTPLLQPAPERPRRRALIPRWVWVSLGVSAILVLATVALVLHFVVVASENVPDVVGTDLGVARVDLQRAGFDPVVGERRFSTRPAGEVIGQQPLPGTHARRGTAVLLVVSAGTEEVVMPDVIGDGIALARGRLADLGLEVKIEAQLSERPKDTVLATNPSPGAKVRTGDVVRVTVAAEGTASSAMLPYRLAGKTFVIDPSAVASGSIDAPLEVTRRLRSLLEASGATVIVTRSLADAGGAVATRIARASEASATALVGLDVPATGSPGLGVFVRTTGDPALLARDAQLANTLAQALADGGVVPTRGTLVSDPILSVMASPAARVRLGSANSRTDVASFRDPTWADTVARSVYRAIGSLYATP
ncbi:MAG: PASTA domain-containing protein [Actinomycetota bacterium]|nr:PASTA domain-containing protein [Actinomycetota bacterium]